MNPYNTIIFDLGAVLIDWNPLHLYGNYFESEEKRDYFFKNICTPDWNEEQDAGRSIVDATQELVAKFPEWEQPIRDFYGRWTEMLGGPITESVAIFKELKETGRYKIYALTNWQASLFEIALVRYNFLHWFDGRVVSGEEKTRKPYAAFYQRLLNRYQVNPAQAVFIDDNLRNIKGAEALGIKSIHFKDPAQLKNALKELKLL
ncbi:MAG: HAD family phosphatase [Sphingobacteriales bacterium]|nr:MAG: HAD family phosphatase [Sphingobacteriales bacterium]